MNVPGGCGCGASIDFIGGTYVHPGHPLPRELPPRSVETLVLHSHSFFRLLATHGSSKVKSFFDLTQAMFVIIFLLQTNSRIASALAN